MQVIRIYFINTKLAGENLGLWSKHKIKLELEITLTGQQNKDPINIIN